MGDRSIDAAQRTANLHRTLPPAAEATATQEVLRSPEFTSLHDALAQPGSYIQYGGKKYIQATLGDFVKANAYDAYIKAGGRPEDNAVAEQTVAAIGLSGVGIGVISGARSAAVSAMVKTNIQQMLLALKNPPHAEIR